MSSDCNRRRLETIPAAAVGGEKEVDRISGLPDEIIHRILSLVDPQKEAAKASVLSHRWSKLWRSYPILEFHNTQFASTESAERFAAAASEKFSPSIAVEAVRIKFNHQKEWDVNFCSAFLDNMLDLAAKRSPLPQEIDIEAEFDRKTHSHVNFDGSGTYSIPRGLLLPRSNSNPNHRFRLKILKLVNCNFDRFKDIEINSNHFSGLGSSLRQLFLTQVSFPAGCQILNSIIAGASLLQELFLCVVPGIWRLQFRNLGNLKVLDIHECPVEYLEITGVHSLETLCITEAPLGGDFVVSPMPNLKSLNIHDACQLTQEKFDELISKSPSLESLSVGGLAKVQELKIFNADKLWRLGLSCWAQLRAIEMKAPKLCDFRYSGRIDFFIKFLGEVGSYRKEARQSLEARYWSFGTDEKEFHALRKFLAQLTQFWFRLTLDFYFRESYEHRWEEFQEKSPIPRVEHIQIEWDFSILINKDAFFDDLFQNFHPNYLSFTREEYSYSTSTEDYLVAVEYVCKKFMERNSNNHCGTTCKCWHHQFKDMKIIKRVRDGRIKVEDGDKVMDISPDTCSSFAEAKQILLLLIWD